jgi:hypothetical protein
MKTVKFLDYEINNSGNSDGYVITKRGGELHETHLGNYSTLDDAQRSAVIHFMIARPKDFVNQIFLRAIGETGSYMEFFTFKRVLDREGIELPKEVTSGDHSNFMIYYKDRPLRF